MYEIVTVIGPANIALIKYWGKRDENLIIPLHDSVSATLDTSVMCAKTSVCAHPSITENGIWLNGTKTQFDNPRLKNCLHEVKRIAAAQKSVSEEFLTWNVRICSENNFPTAAGLASSAAGYASIAYALAKLYKIECEISTLARLGSGSACRSIYGGFVKWQAGANTDGSDSAALQIVEPSHWPEMRVLILIAAETKKHLSSSQAMKYTAETSSLFKHRIKYLIPNHIRDISLAIKERNFPKFAEIVMKESNQFHACCLDTYPPCAYLTDVSFKVIKTIHAYNKYKGEPKVAYTFQAGPNACLFLLEKYVSEVIALIKHVFPMSNPKCILGLPVKETECTEFLNKIPQKPFQSDLLKFLIYTKIGEGPQIVDIGSHLLNENGCPINIKFDMNDKGR